MSRQPTPTEGPPRPRTAALARAPHRAYSLLALATLGGLTACAAPNRPAPPTRSPASAVTQEKDEAPSPRFATPPGAPASSPTAAAPALGGAAAPTSRAPGSQATRDGVDDALTLPEAIRTFEQEATTLSRSLSRCAEACRALSVLERAARRICAVGEDEVRCDDAKSRLREARARVRERCKACPDGASTDPDAPI